MCASGCPRRRPPASSIYDAETGAVHAVAGAGGRVRRRGQPRQHDRRLLLAGRRLRRRAEARRRPSRPARASAGASAATACSAASSASSARATRRTSLGEWLPALDGVVGQAGARREGGRRRLRPRRLDASSWPRRFPNSEFVGIDFHDASIAQAREHANGLRQRALRDGAGAGLRRLGLRPRHHVRCPARHGRSGRRGARTRARR